MDILFGSTKLAKTCISTREAVRSYGPLCAKALRLRLDEARAAPTLAVLGKLPHTRCHELTGDRKGQLAVDLRHPQRLIFAPVCALPEHLARLTRADLFLDTLPCNAHTTASDALWAGVPVMTCLGTAFAGRVAASLLHAVGLPELVTDNLAAYEALALRLARNPAVLAAIRRKLQENRLTQPLFDTERFRRHIEAAYTRMWEIFERGAPPQSFSVEPIA